jgi:NADH-quinone oxidoreductase subunit A
MMIDYIPILLMFGLALGVALGLVAVSQLLGQHIPTREKLMPYECGKDPVGSAHERFSVKFYMVALLFILFDIEAIFFVPWAVVYRKIIENIASGQFFDRVAHDLSKSFIFGEMLIFIAVLLVGYIYVWKKGILDWKK